MKQRSRSRLAVRAAALAALGVAGAALVAAPSHAAEACETLDASFRGQVMLGDFAAADGDVVKAGATYLHALADGLTLTELCAEDDALTAERRAAFDAMRERVGLDRKFAELLAKSSVETRTELSETLKADADAASSAGRQAASAGRALTAESKFEQAALFFDFAARAAPAPDAEALIAERAVAARAAASQRCRRLSDEADSFVRYGERSEEFWIASGEAQARFDAAGIYQVAAARLRDLKAECGASRAPLDDVIEEIDARIAALR